jgi:Tol biopolymer transport system component
VLHRVLACSVLAACSFTSGSTTVSSDGHVVADAAADAAADALDALAPPQDGSVNCFAAWHVGPLHFTMPAAIAFTDVIPTNVFERDPFLSPDEKTLYFGANLPPPNGLPNTGAEDVYIATRSALDQPFGTPAVYLPASSPNNESKMSMTLDGSFLVVASDRPGGQGGVDIWGGSPAAALTEMHLAAHVDTGDDQLDPDINDAGTHLYFAPKPNGTQEIDIATRATINDDFGSPQRLANLFSGQDDGDPAVSPDERILVFSTRRNVGSVGVELFFATRTDPTADFGTPVAIPDVNSPMDDNDPVLSRDGCRLYFSSNRGGTDILYVTSVM